MNKNLLAMSDDVTERYFVNEDVLEGVIRKHFELKEEDSVEFFPIRSGLQQNTGKARLIVNKVIKRRHVKQ